MRRDEIERIRWWANFEWYCTEHPHTTVSFFEGSLYVYDDTLYTYLKKEKA